MQRLAAEFERSCLISHDPKCASEGTTEVMATTHVASEGDEDPPHPTTEAATSSTPRRERSSGISLESLPPEVRRLILLSLQLPELRFLVRASSVFHRQYFYDRKYVLCQTLQRTLGGVAVDAYTVHLLATPSRKRTENTAEVLRLYSENTARRRLQLADKLTQEEAISMAAFYFQHVKVVAEEFVRWILRNIADANEQNVGGIPDSHVEFTHPSLEFTWFKRTYQARELVSLTDTEAMRFTRAVYRFQLLCHLADPDDKDTRLWREENVQAFLDILEPWEREELYALYQFGESIYEAIFRSILMDLHPTHPRFDKQGRPPTPDGAFYLLTSRSDIPDYTEGTLLRGLDLMRRVLLDIKDHEDLVTTMQRHITRSHSPFNGYENMILAIFGPELQDYRRQTSPSKHDRMQEERIQLPFRGDGEPDAPPLGWTMIWGDTYSNLLGYYTGDSLLQIGYVFWDAATMEDIEGQNVAELIRRRWENEWGGDPRDYII